MVDEGRLDVHRVAGLLFDEQCAQFLATDLTDMGRTLTPRIAHLGHGMKTRLSPMESRYEAILRGVLPQVSSLRDRVKMLEGVVWELARRTGLAPEEHGPAEEPPEAPEPEETEPEPPPGRSEPGLPVPEPEVEEPGESGADVDPAELPGGTPVGRFAGAPSRAEAALSQALERGTVVDR